jgi:hypothetical protein
MKGIRLLFLLEAEFGRMVMPIKNSNDTIENRTRDLPACSAVPQSTAPPRVPPVNKVNFI